MIERLQERPRLRRERNFVLPARGASRYESNDPKVLQATASDRLTKSEVVRKFAFARGIANQCAEHGSEVALPERLQNQLRLPFHLRYAIPVFMALKHFAGRPSVVIVREREPT
jgi:hypothetical protein